MVPVPPANYPVADEFADQRVSQIVTVGERDDVAIAVHVSTAPVDGVRCVVLTTTLDVQAPEWVSGCGDGPLTIGGQLGSWLVWPDLPDGTAFVAVANGDDLTRYQRPTADTVAFNGAFGTANGLALIAYGADGTELERRNLTPESGAAPTTQTQVTSTQTPIDDPPPVGADERTVASCEDPRLDSGSVDAVAPFTIDGGPTASGGAWISILDARDLTVVSTCDDVQTLGDSGVRAQIVWPSGGDVYLAIIEPLDSVFGPTPTWAEVVDRYELWRPIRSTAAIARVTADTQLPDPADVDPPHAEGERELIDKVEQVRMHDNLVTSFEVAPSIDPSTVLERGGGVDGPVMYWSERPEGERMSEAAAIGGVLSVDGDCFYLGTGPSAVAVLWPFGTRWQPDPAAVILPDGTELPIGNEFSGGGGFHPVGSLAAFTASDDVIARAVQCSETNSEIAVIQ